MRYLSALRCDAEPFDVDATVRLPATEAAESRFRRVRLRRIFALRIHRTVATGGEAVRVITERYAEILTQALVERPRIRQIR
jgi:hypothetical protein